jgi:uncharacterized protein
MDKAQAPSTRTRVRRLPDRARYDAATRDAIIDSAWICHVAFQWEGSVHLLATSHWREGEYLYVHGAKASRMLKALRAGEACVCISHVDALVFARSAFHHSMNYRSVVVYGRFEEVEDPADKTRVLERFIDKFAPGRWAELRPVSAKELSATAVLRLSLHEASAKIRDAGVKDDEEDLAWPVWAGVLPLALTAGEPVTDPQSVVDRPPAYLPVDGRPATAPTQSR